MSSKKSKSKKSHSAPKVYKYFNVADKNDFQSLLKSELDRVSETYNVRKIEFDEVVGKQFTLVEPRYPEIYDPLTNWKASFFKHYFDKIEECRSPTKQFLVPDGDRFWLDLLINQCSVMVHNLVFYRYYLEGLRSGTVPENNLPKKLRNSIEAVANHFADEESGRFRVKFL